MKKDSLGFEVSEPIVIPKLFPGTMSEPYEVDSDVEITYEGPGILEYKESARRANRHKNHWAGRGDQWHGDHHGDRHGSW